MTDDVEQFWVGVANHKDASGENDFSKLSDFVLSMLALPFSNSTVERAFSQMNLIKTKFRNRMKQDMLEALLQIKHREFCCDTGKIFETQGKYFDCILLCECYIFMYFWQSWFQIMGVCR